MSRRWGRGFPAAGIIGNLPNLVPLQKQGESSRMVEIRVDVISPEQYPTRSRSILPNHAPVAQLDRVLASEAKGHRFESCRARQVFKGPFRSHGLHLIPETWLTLSPIGESKPQMDELARYSTVEDLWFVQWPLSHI